MQNTVVCVHEGRSRSHAPKPRTRFAVTIDRPGVKFGKRQQMTQISLPFFVLLLWCLLLPCECVRSLRTAPSTGCGTGVCALRVCALPLAACSAAVAQHLAGAKSKRVDGSSALIQPLS